MCLLARLLVLVLVVFISGCGSPLTLQTQDVVDKVWLQYPFSDVGSGGFYLHPDGSALKLDGFEFAEWTWFIKAGRLLVAEELVFSAAAVDGQVCLVPDSKNGRTVYCPVDLESLVSGKKYAPFFPNAFDEKTAPLRSPVYLQFDSDDGVVRGFGGVNNFRGKFSRKDLRSIDFGPIMATKMAGPGLDDELRLIQCLDRTDRMLVVKGHLYLYQGTQFLCSFYAVPE